MHRLQSPIKIPFFSLFIILVLFGVCHSFLSCLGELPVVNSSVGSNCCTCNCQSTLQAILQELKTMRKLMQIQAGTMLTHQIQPPDSSCISDIFSWDVYYGSIVESFPLCCLYMIFQVSIFSAFSPTYFPLENNEIFIFNTTILAYMCSVYLTPGSPSTSQM